MKPLSESQVGPKPCLWYDDSFFDYASWLVSSSRRVPLFVIRSYTVTSSACSSFSTMAPWLYKSFDPTLFYFAFFLRSKLS